MTIRVDDPTSMAIRKVTLCPESGRLVVGGTAGQVIVFDLADSNQDSDSALALPEVVKADLVTEKVSAMSTKTWLYQESSLNF